MVKRTESNILLIVFFTEQTACDAHTTYLSNASVPETDSIFSVSLSVFQLCWYYFGRTNYYTYGLLLRIRENEFSFMFCISFYELSFLVYLNFVNQGFLGNFFSLWSSQNQGKGKVTSWCREVHNIPLRHKARKQAGSLFCLECYSVGLRGIGGEG